MENGLLLLLEESKSFGEFSNFLQAFIKSPLRNSYPIAQIDCPSLEMQHLIASPCTCVYIFTCVSHVRNPYRSLSNSWKTHFTCDGECDHKTWGWARTERFIRVYRDRKGSRQPEVSMQGIFDEINMQQFDTDVSGSQSREGHAASSHNYYTGEKVPINNLTRGTNDSN